MPLRPSHLPIVKDGEILIYRRLTGLRGGSVQDVERFMREGVSLTPHNERGSDYEDDPAEMHGIDPIDIAAGDGSAVFFTPFAPIQTGKWAKSLFSRGDSVPGVAFKLSALNLCCEVSVRARDFQTYYLNLINSSDLQDAFSNMQTYVDSPYDHIFELEKLAGLLELIRSAERWDVDFVLRNIPRLGVDVPAVPAVKLDRAISEALAFYADFGGDRDPDEFYESEEQERVEDSIKEAFEEQYHQAWNSWDVVNPENVEVLAWGSVPLDKACLIFTEDKVVERSC